MRFAVVLTIALGGCTTGDTTASLARTLDACSPLALVSAAPSDVQHAGMEGAQDLWRDRGAPSLGYRAGATLEVRFDSAAPQFHGLYDDQAGVIYVNQDLVDPGLLSIVIAHELGHAFGLLHIDAGERASVMNPGNLTTPPTDADQAAIEALWGACQ